MSDILHEPPSNSSNENAAASGQSDRAGGQDRRKAAVRSHPLTTAPTLQATAGEYEVALDWTDVDPGELGHYELETSTGGGNWSRRGGDITGSAYTITGRTACITHYYRVRAVSPDGQQVGPYSNEASAVPRTASTAPSVSAAYAGGSAVRLRWSSVSAAAHYTVSSYYDDAWHTVGSRITDTEYLHSGLTAGKSYWYQVQGYTSGGAGLGPSCLSSRFEPPTTPPPIVSITTAGQEVNACGSISLTASVQGDSPRYAWSVEPDTTRFANASAKDTTWRAPSLVADSSHTLTLTATDRYNREASDSVVMTVPSSPGPGVVIETVGRVMGTNEPTIISATPIGCYFSYAWRTDPPGAGNFASTTEREAPWASPEPTSRTDYTLIVTVTDLSGRTDSDSIVMTVDPVPTAPFVGAVTFYVDQQNSQVLPAGEGGDWPLRYSVSGLPSSLSFNANSRVISGTPTEAEEGEYTVTYTITDRHGETASTTFALEVTETPSLEVDIKTLSQTVGRGASVSLTAETTGRGIITHAWSVDPSGGTFSPPNTEDTEWTAPYPSRRTTYELTLSAANNLNESHSDSVFITVPGPVPQDRRPSLPSVGDIAYRAGQTVARTMPAGSGGDGSLRYEMTGLPAGLAFDAATRGLGGAPATPGASTVTYRVRDADGDTATRTFTLAVEAELGDDSLFDSSVSAATPGVAWLGAPSQRADSDGAVVLVDGSHLDRRVDRAVDAAYVSGSDPVYLTWLKLRDDGGIELHLNTDNTVSTGDAVARFTADAAANLGLALRTDDGSVFKWSLSDLTADDPGNPHAFTATAVAAAGAALDAAALQTIGDNAPCRLILVDRMHSRIDWDSLQTHNAVRLDSLAALQSIFDFDDASQSGGRWNVDPAGTTPTSSTGPGSNSAGPYVYSETDGASLQQIIDNSVLTVKDDVMADWTGTDRTLHLRAAIAGNGWTGANEGLRIEGLDAEAGGWEEIALLPGWAYSSGYQAGDEITDRAGADLRCVQDGGWVDYVVDIPGRYGRLRLHANPVSGSANQHDLALWQIELRDGVPSVNILTDDQTVSPGNTLILAADAFGIDPEYAWTAKVKSGDHANTGVFGSLDTPGTTWTAPSPSSESVITLTLTLTDGAETVSDSIDVTVPVESAPTLPAVDNFIYAAGQTVAQALPAGVDGNAPLSHALTGLPAGLAYDETAGGFSGAPTTPGAYAVEYTVTDDNGDVAAASFIVAVLGEVGDNSLFHSSVTAAAPGVAWLGAPMQSADGSGAVVAVDGANADRRVDQIIDAGYVSGNGAVYITWLKLLDDGGIELHLNTDNTVSTGAAAVQFNANAAANLGLALRTADGSVYKWILSELTADDVDNPHAFTATAVAAAGAVLDTTALQTIGDNAPCQLILVDRSDRLIDWDSLQKGSLTRLDSYEALDAIFVRYHTGSHGGGWKPHGVGSTTTSNTGPGSNSDGPYIHSDSTSAISLANIALRSRLTVRDDVMANWTGVGRSLHFRAAIAGDGWIEVDEGLEIEGRASMADSWTPFTLFPGWAYSDGYAAGDTIIDSVGNELPCVQAGGWVDFMVEIPDEYTELRLHSLPVGSEIRANKHDIALWEIELRDGALLPPQPTVDITTVDQSLAPGGSVGLAADATGAGLSYAWTAHVAGPGGMAVGGFMDADAAGASWTAPMSAASMHTTYTLTLTVTDVAGQTAADTVDVTVLASLGVSIETDGPAVVAAGGSIELTAVLDGAGPFTFTWKDGGGTIAVSPTDDGAATWTAPVGVPTMATPYTVKLEVENSAGQTADAAIVITVPALPTAEIETDGPAVAAAGDSIELTAAAEGAGPLEFTWGGGGDGMLAVSPTNERLATWTAPMGVPTVATPYTVTLQARDAAMQTVDVEIEITVPALPTVAIETDGPAVVAASAPIELRAAPAGTGPFAFTWGGGGDGMLAVSPTDEGLATWTAPVGVPMEETTYTVTLQAGDAAMQTVDAEIEITVPALPTVAIETDGPAVVAAGNSIELTADPDGTGPFTYTWMDDGGALAVSPTDEGMATWTAPAGTPVTETTYAVTLLVQDAVHQVARAAIAITVPAVTDITIAADEAVDAETVVDLTVTTAGAGPFTYAWISDRGGAFADLGAANTMWTAPAPINDTTCTLTLAVTDVHGQVTTRSVAIRVRSALMGTVAVYIVEKDSNTLWAVDPENPRSTASGYGDQGAMPAGLGRAMGAVYYQGALWVLGADSRALWRIDPAAPDREDDEYGNRGALPAGLEKPRGITALNGVFWVVDPEDSTLWKIDPTEPGRADGDFGTPAGLPAALTGPRGVTAYKGDLWVADNDSETLWRVNPDEPGDATGRYGNKGRFPSDLETPLGVAAFDDSMWVVDNTGDELWRLHPTPPNQGPFWSRSLPDALTDPHGVTLGPPPPTVSIEPPAQPIVAAGQEVDLAVTVSGYGLAYAWSGGGSFADVHAGNTTWTAPPVPPQDATEYSLRLTVTDLAGQQAVAEVAITVAALPTATISRLMDTLVSSGSSLILAGLATGTGRLGIKWSGGGAFTSSTSLATFWTAPELTENGDQEEIVIKLTVSDDFGQVVCDEIEIAVAAPPAVMITGPSIFVHGDTSVRLRAVVNGAGPFNYAWTGDGSFDNNTVADPIWNVPAFESGTEYSVSVRVLDILLQETIVTAKFLVTP